MTTPRETLAVAKRWVVKIGSALLTADGRGVDRPAIETWVGQMARLRQSGKEIVLVSSGAVAEGMARLGWSQRPRELFNLQAAAAVGQMGMIQAYETAFQQHGLHTAQILITHEDLSNRTRYLNARGTLNRLLELGVVPIINENDSVATDEIRFGDNDTLGALITNLIEARVLVILTDQTGLYTADPRQDPEAELVREGRAGDPELSAMAGATGGGLGRGGMATKLRAAALAARSGASTVIASGREPNVLPRIAAGDAPGTVLVPEQSPRAARKNWLASHLQMRGRLVLDPGAVRALRDAGKSLLAAGITAVEGDFERGEMVVCLTPDQRELARGLVNYGATELRQVLGQPSSRFESILGYVDEPEIIHRDNLALL